MRLEYGENFHPLELHLNLANPEVGHFITWLDNYVWSEGDSPESGEHKVVEIGLSQRKDLVQDS